MLDSETYVAPIKNVAVVLCTYNGAKHIAEQAQSLLSQRYPVQIYVSDDCSSDETVLRLEPLLRKGIDSLHVQQKNTGYVRNFENSLSEVLVSDAEYFALSDQDDIWEEDRVQSGMDAMLELELKYGSNTPFLVHSDLRLIGDSGEEVHDSFLGYRRYRIGQEKCLPIMLGENGVMGNTILMNRALAELCMPFPPQLHVHDYWIALIAELFGQRTLLETPLVNYRLHSTNASNTAHSMKRGVFALIENSGFKKMLRRNFKLPFKEDSRLKIVEYVLNNQHRFPQIEESQYQQLTAFAEFLRFEQPRFRSVKYMLSANVIRKGFFHRLRVCFAALTTQRYNRI